MLRRIAFHEAGHVVAALALGHQVERVVIDPDGTLKDQSGKKPRQFARWSDGLFVADMDLQQAGDKALVMFAGDAADMYLMGGRPVGESFDHGGDYWEAMVAAAKFHPEIRERHAFLEAMDDRARAFVREPLRWRQITALAFALLEQHELTGDEAAALVVGAPVSDLARGVLDALLWEDHPHRTYSDWARSALLANGLDPASIDARALPHVLHQLVHTGRAVPASSFIDSVVWAEKRKEIMSQLEW